MNIIFISFYQWANILNLLITLSSINKFKLLKTINVALIFQILFFLVFCLYKDKNINMGLAHVPNLWLSYFIKGRSGVSSKK